MPEQTPDAGGQDREKLAAVLSAHDAYHVNDDGRYVCICGHVAEGVDDDGSHARHLADVLADLLRAERAKALREAAQAIGEGDGISTFIGMDPLDAAVRAEKRAQAWLRERADRIERGE